MADASKCCVCGEQGHTGARCPQLYAPLREGFYTGGGGGGGHSHDDDEKVDLLAATLTQQVATNNEHDERCLNPIVLSALPRSRLTPVERSWDVATPSICYV